MEPESAYYSPLVVLDFQSLYPSIMIAYNYCYSTFLGRCALFQGRNKFGVTELDMPPGLLETIGEENIHGARICSASRIRVLIVFRIELPPMEWRTRNAMCVKGSLGGC